MGHDHSHSHAHHHDHAAGVTRGARLWLAFGLTICMMLVEVIGGLWSGSLALLADAAHMLVDSLALLMAAVTAIIAKRPADSRRSYGYARIEVLSGFASSILQFTLITYILIMAVQRLWHPGEILSGVMFWIALIGLAINVVVLGILHHHDEDDVNMRGAALHVLGDLLGSIGAIGAALLIGNFGWLWADPILSVLVSLLILRGAWSLLRRSGHILLEGVPEDLETSEMLGALNHAHPDIVDVHHLHVWQLASGKRFVTLHAGLRPGANPTTAMKVLQGVLRTNYRIDHTTIQIETDSCLDGGRHECSTHQDC